MSAVPEFWRGPFSPRDPLREPRTRQFGDPPRYVDPVRDETAQRADQQRDLVQEALERMRERS